MYRYLKKLCGVIKIYFVLSVLLAFICITLQVRAENNSVQVLAEKESIYSSEDTINVEIVFEENELYNEHIYLSYHVKNMQGDVLQYENSRYSIVLDEDNTATVAVDINVNDIETENGVLLLEFDIVDEENLFWFSDRKDINFQTSVVRCETKGIGRLIDSLKQEIENKPGAFLCNAIVFMVFVVIIFLILKIKNNSDDKV